MRVVPADRVGWDDVRAVFGARGTSARCWCQRLRLARGESFGTCGPDVLADRLREQVEGSDGVPTTGLVAYRGDEPVGWCAVAPRASYPGLVRGQHAAWTGRRQDRAEPGVWAVTCLLARAGHRRQGVSRALAVAAVAFARDHGARAVEAYPMTTTAAIAEELHPGTVATFEAAGLRVVHRATPRRVVMRLDLSP